MHADFETVCDRFHAELAGIDAATAHRHPAGDQRCWCMQQIVEHLLLTYRGTCAALQRRIEKGTATQVRPGWKQILSRTLVLRFGYFPHGRKSPEAVSPPINADPVSSGAELADRMREDLALMDAMLAAAEKQFGRTPLHPHFAFGPLTAEQWRRFHAMHAMHHLKQISRIRRSAD